MFVGVLLGLAVALAIAFYLNKAPMPFQTARPPKRTKTSPLASRRPSPACPRARRRAGNPAEKPKFDFYKILPGQEEPVSEKELRERTRQARSGQQPGRRTFISYRRDRSRTRPRRQPEGEASDPRL